MFPSSFRCKVAIRRTKTVQSMLLSLFVALVNVVNIINVTQNLNNTLKPKPVSAYLKPVASIAFGLCVT